MALPADYQTCHVTGRWVNNDAPTFSPAVGWVTFTPQISAAVSPGEETIVLPGDIVVFLDENGEIAVDLPATDDPDITPLGFTYRVVETLDRGREYNIEAPHDVDIDLSTVVGVPADTGETIARGVAGDPGPAGGDVVGMSKADRGLARWRLSTRAQRHIIYYGDSVVQGAGINGKVSGPPDFLRTHIRNEWGVTVHDGFQPMRWSQPFGGFTHRWVKDAGWANAGNSASNLGVSGQGIGAVRSTSGVRSLTWTRPASVQVGQIIVFWVDDSSTNVGGWSYSTAGSGGPWTTVTPTAPGTPTMKITTVNVTNPTDFRIRSANAAGTGYASPVFLGIDIRADLLGTGWVVHNMGSAGASLTGSAASNTNSDMPPERAGDWGALFDAYQPELVIWGVSNDSVDVVYDLSRVNTAIDTLLARITPYADVVCMGFPEQFNFGRNPANQTAVRNASIAKTIAAGGGAVNFRTRWGTNAEAIALGLMEAVAYPVHPNEVGDKEIGSTMARFLRIYA